MGDEGSNSVDVNMHSEAGGGILSVNGRPFRDNERRELKRQLEAGELDGIEFDAVVFRQGPNANHYRFRDRDLLTFALSFKGQPFLRDHKTYSIEARDGTILSGELIGTEFIQRVRLTTDRGMKSFLEGQIDRFSIGWYYEGVTCTVCNEDWMRCSHWPGRKYTVRDENGNEQEILAEIIFESPRGKETSAVNAPAVPGTHILASLYEQKQLRLAATPKKGKSTMEKETEVKEQTEVQNGAMSAQDDVWGAYLRTQAIDTALAASRLPVAAQAAVRASLEGRANLTPADVDAAIAAQRAALAEAAEKSTVRGVNPLDSQMGSLEKIQIALDGLLAARRPVGGVRPLTGIREAYVLLSGDYDFHGRFIPENVGLANVNSSTMAGMVANALNKVVVNMFQAYPKDFLKICVEEDFSTLQDVRWITLGGVGELPTVSEGAAYTELTWDDQTETDAFTKKGGYLGLTLEAIDKDDTRRLQQAPRALAQSAWLTLLKSFSAIFTVNSGTGPAMSDSQVLFHATHNNIGSTALSYSGWNTTRIAMRKQTELNSGERLGGIVVPKFLLVPPDLEATAIQIIASELQPGTGNNDVNPIGEDSDSRASRLQMARERVIVMDFWTDTKKWAVAADPMLYPSIGIGYRYGRTPEIFSVADANSGLMFSNDVMPVKVRWFYAIGPVDWRGLYKQNAS